MSSAWPIGSWRLSRWLAPRAIICPSLTMMQPMGTSSPQPRASSSARFIISSSLITFNLSDLALTVEELSTANICTHNRAHQTILFRGGKHGLDALTAKGQPVQGWMGRHNAPAANKGVRLDSQNQ